MCSCTYMETGKGLNSESKAAYDWTELVGGVISCCETCICATSWYIDNFTANRSEYGEGQQT